MTPEQRQAKLSVLKSLVNIPVPHDEEWTSEYQAGVEHGFRLYESKLKFEIRRLKKLIQ